MSNLEIYLLVIPIAITGANWLFSRWLLRH